MRTPGGWSEMRMRLGTRVVLLAFAGSLCASGANAQIAAANSELGPASTSASAGTPQAADGVVARSARLSFLLGPGDGSVHVVRGNDNERFPAQPNMALGQGDRVTTADRGQAEIEFEDGSVARLTPNSGLSLDFMGTDSGGKGAVTILRVMRGLVYLELRASSAMQFRVMAAGDAFWPVENTTVRVSLDDPPTVLAVMDGKIRVEHVAAEGSDVAGPQVIQGYRTDVHAGESIRSDAADASHYFLSEAVAPGTWDQWNEQREQSAADSLANATSVRENYAGAQGYGWGDLDANGTWYAGDGQPPVWQPQEALSEGFDPYGYGSWTYFPGAGYTWASAYGWGWTPYRCGRWEYWDGFGWGWQPDSFCGNYWRFGGAGINVHRRPRWYVPPGVPIRRPGGVHPIVPGPHPGERPPFERRVTHEAGERTIAGILVRPITPAGFGRTPRGGSAIGSSLRRDFPVDSRTHTAVAGVPGGGVLPPRQPVSAAVGWRSVSARPDSPAPESRGKFLGIIGHGARPSNEAPVALDPKGNPYSPSAAHTGLLQGRPQQGAAQQRIERSQAVVQGQTQQRAPSASSQSLNRSQASSGTSTRSAPSYQSAPRTEQHSAPSSPVMHSSPPTPAASASGAVKK